MLLVDAGADSCYNFFWVKEDDFTYDTVRMYIKHKIVRWTTSGCSFFVEALYHDFNSTNSVVKFYT